MGTVEDIFAEVLRLSMAAGLPLVVTLGLLLAAAVILVLARKVKLPKGESGGPPNPDGAYGDGGPPGPGSPLNTDPENPGGGPTGGMG